MEVLQQPVATYKFIKALQKEREVMRKQIKLNEGRIMDINAMLAKYARGPYECDGPECEKKFDTLAELEKHMRETGHE